MGPRPVFGAGLSKLSCEKEVWQPAAAFGIVEPRPVCIWGAFLRNSILKNQILNAG